MGRLDSIEPLMRIAQMSNNSRHLLHEKSFQEKKILNYCTAGNAIFRTAGRGRRPGRSVLVGGAVRLVLRARPRTVLVAASPRCDPMSLNK
jgi:hypothetical protein